MEQENKTEQINSVNADYLVKRKQRFSQMAENELSKTISLHSNPKDAFCQGFERAIQIKREMLENFFNEVFEAWKLEEHFETNKNIITEKYIKDIPADKKEKKELYGYVAGYEFYPMDNHLSDAEKELMTPVYKISSDPADNIPVSDEEMIGRTRFAETTNKEIEANLRGQRWMQERLTNSTSIPVSAERKPLEENKRGRCKECNNYLQPGEGDICEDCLCPA